VRPGRLGRASGLGRECSLPFRQRGPTSLIGNLPLHQNSSQLRDEFGGFSPDGGIKILQAHFARVGRLLLNDVSPLPFDRSSARGFVIIHRDAPASRASSLRRSSRRHPENSVKGAVGSLETTRTSTRCTFQQTPALSPRFGDPAELWSVRTRACM